MRNSHYTHDDGRYMAYYMNQAGGELPGFIGSQTQYGNGLGGIFRGLLRMALPLLKRGFSLAKPHLKTAATNIIGDVVSNIAKGPFSGAQQQPEQQQGHGMLIHTRRALKRPPTGRGGAGPGTKKCKRDGRNKAGVKKKSGTARRGSQIKRARILAKDIF